jgi:hypothetical protein
VSGGKEGLSDEPLCGIVLPAVAVSIFSDAKKKKIQQKRVEMISYSRSFESV